MTTAFGSVWSGILLMLTVITILVAQVSWQLWGYGTPPSDLYRVLLGLYVLLIVWELFHGRVLSAALWFACAVMYYYLLRRQSPPGGKSVGSRLRVPKWLRG